MPNHWGCAPAMALPAAEPALPSKHTKDLGTSDFKRQSHPNTDDKVSILNLFLLQAKNINPSVFIRNSQKKENRKDHPDQYNPFCLSVSTDSSTSGEDLSLIYKLQILATKKCAWINFRLSRLNIIIYLSKPMVKCFADWLKANLATFTSSWWNIYNLIRSYSCISSVTYSKIIIWSSKTNY